MAATLDPNRLTPSDRLLVRDLAQAIEVNAGRGAIFVLVAAAGKRNNCAHGVLEALPGYGERLIAPGVDVLPAVIQRGPFERTLYSLPTYTLDANALTSLLRGLNYRRELVAEHGITVLLWLDEAGLSAVPRHAKDFWSFRTGTYRFDAPLTVSKGEMPALEAKRAEIADTERLLREAERSGAGNAELAPIYFRLGRLHYDIGELDSALGAFKRSESAYEGASDRRNRGAALGNIGLIARYKGDLEAGIQALEQALSIHLAVGDRQAVASDLGNLGNIYREKGAIKAALNAHEEAGEIFRALGDRLGVANQLGSIGIVHQVTGDVERALKAHEEALAIYREIGYPQGVANALGNMGPIYRDKGDLDAALRTHKVSLADFRAIGDRQGVANQLGNVGLIYRDKGDSDAALKALEEALAIDREIGYRQGLAGDLDSLGLIYKDKGDLGAALKAHEEALEISGSGRSGGVPQSP